MKPIVALLALVIAAPHAAAACVNRFVVRNERPRQVVTLLTGKLTFQEAQALAAAIDEKKSAPIEWLGDGGKVVARQVGSLRVVRPMPVGCDGKTSGVVVVATFLSQNAPSKKMTVKLDADTIVSFDEQAE